MGGPTVSLRRLCACCGLTKADTLTCMSCGRLICQRCQFPHFVEVHAPDEAKHMEDLP